jgi:hypothetical protein
MDTTNVSGLILIFPLNLTSCSFRSFLKKISGISEVLPSQQQQQQQQQVPPKNKEDLIHEIKRLRERIRGLESDNAALHLKMSRAQKDVDQVQ